MSCQYLSGRHVKMCGAFDGALVLSVDELTCCTTPNYQHCKIYKKAQKEGAKLALGEYRTNYVLPSV